MKILFAFVTHNTMYIIYKLNKLKVPESIADKQF